MELELSADTEDVVFLETAVRFLITKVLGVTIVVGVVVNAPAFAGGAGGGAGELLLFSEGPFILICWCLQ